MASPFSIFSRYPSLSARSNLSTTPKPNLIARNPLAFRNPHKPAISVSALASAAGGSKRYKGTVKREEALSEMIEKKVAEAIEACEGDEVQKVSEECRVAWDEVEEVSQAKADLWRKAAASILLNRFAKVIQNPTNALFMMMMIDRQVACV